MRVRLERGPNYVNFGSAPRVIRTPDLLIRSQTLYPTELWARAVKSRSYRHRACRASAGGHEGADASVEVGLACTLPPDSRPALDLSISVEHEYQIGRALN